VAVVVLARLVAQHVEVLQGCSRQGQEKRQCILLSQKKTSGKVDRGPVLTLGSGRDGFFSR
jgi:hypothetical protein